MGALSLSCRGDGLKGGVVAIDLAQLANLGEFIGGVGSVLGAIAVLAALIYLASQVKQNTAAIRAGSAQAFADSMNGTQFLTVEHAHVWRLAMEDPSAMTDDERVAADWICLSAFTSFDSALLQAELGSLDQQTHGMVRLRIRESFDVGYIRSWWDRRAFGFTDRMVRLVEQECGVTPGGAAS